MKNFANGLCRGLYHIPRKNIFAFFFLAAMSIIFLPEQTQAAVPNITWDPIKTLFTAGDIGQYAADNNPGVIKIDSTRFDWFFNTGNLSYSLLRGPAEKPNETIRKNVNDLSWINRNGVQGVPWIVGAYKDDSTGDIYGIVHLELREEDGNTNWRSRLAIAKSVDGGLNWSMQGNIVTQQNEQQAGEASNIQSGGVAVKNGYMYVWYLDRSGGGREPAVARAAMSDVLAGRTTQWYKYYNGSFSEPGLGGRYTPLNEWIGSHNSVSFNTYLNKFVVANGWTDQYLLFSDDGIIWGDRIPVEPGDGGATQLYIYSVITSPGFKENTSGQIFDVSYWGYFHSDPYRYTDTRYARRFYIGGAPPPDTTPPANPTGLAVI